MDHNRVNVNGDTIQLCEYIKNRLYFATISAKREPKNTPDVHFFSTDDELVYTNYYSDFGPLNLGMLYRYCLKLNTKLKCLSPGQKKIVHYTSTNAQKRVNAAYLIASYAIIQLNMVPREAFRPLLAEKAHSFRAFQDASIGASAYQIRLMDVLDGVYRAKQCGFFNFDDFDLSEYEFYDSIEHGDLNWILPNKFVAFCGPSTEGVSVYKSPEFYVPYFKKNNVSTVVRLNKKAYDSHVFTAAGIHHFDLYFMDGGVPSQSIAEKFLEIAETAKGAVAVHCKAGLGRTGSLIGAYLMKHYRMTAQEAIAWLRICRPGSVIGRQQAWLEDMECWLWKAGEAYRIQCHGDGDKIPRHPFGIYSYKVKGQKNTEEEPLGGVGFLKYLLEEASQTQKATHDAKVGKKPKTNKKKEGKTAIAKEVKPQSIFTPCRKGQVEDRVDSQSGHKRKKERKSVMPNKKEAKEIKETRDELTQGDHLNLIKGLMKSRLLKNTCKARNDGSSKK